MGDRKLGDHADSGIYIEKPGQNLSLHLRNLDFSPVFKIEFIAIEQGLEAILNECDFGDLWIILDSRNSLQHLNNWITVGDKTSISILLKLITNLHDVHMQWIPDHVDIYGNKQEDRLAKEGDCHSLLLPLHHLPT